MSRLGKILFLLSGLFLVLFAVVRFLLGGWVPFLWVALGLVGLCLVGGFFVDRLFFKEFFSLKTTRQGMSMGSMILMVIVTLSALNFLGGRHYKTWDLSINKVNTLSEQSIQLAKALKDNLKLIYFYQEGAEGVAQNKRLFIELMKKYQDINSNIKLEFVEVNERPDLAQKYNITKGTQSVLLEYQGKTNIVEKIDEQEITSALAKVTREKEKKIVVLSGHGEVPLEDSPDGRSLSSFKALLAGNRYTVESFSFNQAVVIPEDTDVLAIIGPKQQFLEFEIKAIEDYSLRGGSLFLALEPGSQAGLEPFLAKIGLKLGADVIVTVLETPFGRGIDPRFTRGTEFSKLSSISKPFGKNEVVVFRMPQSLGRTQETPQGLEWDELIKSNAQSLSFKDLNFKSDGIKGPFTLAYEIKGKLKPESSQPAHIIVFGDEDIFTNQLLYQNLNRDLALNLISALAKEESLISIMPKDIKATELNLTQTNFIVFIFAFILPLPILFFFLSGFMWFRRRNA